MISPHKILIIRPDRLGDLILSLPVAETLKMNLPQSQIHYFVSPYTVLIAPMVDYVDGWLIDGDNSGNRLSLLRLAKKIKQGGYDCLIELKPSWRTAAAGFLSGAISRIGTSRRFYSFFYTHKISVHRKSSGYHQTDLELKHLESLEPRVYVTEPNVSVTDNGLARAKELLDLNANPYLVIHPGSGGSAPNWPLEHYGKLAALIKKNLDYTIVITNRDPQMSGFEEFINLGGKTDLETLAAVLSRAETFISGSTGPLHLADALGTPCLSFYLSRSDIGPKRWGPRRNMDNVMMPPVSCECTDLKKCRCLEQVSPEKAFEKLQKLLENRKTAGVNKI